MSINEIHFMREKLVKDYRGNLIPTMEISYSNVSALHPIYKEASFYDHSEISKLYHELGGSRQEGALMGSTVILHSAPSFSVGKSVADLSDRGAGHVRPGCGRPLGGGKKLSP
jgi:hypothetical protein